MLRWVLRRTLATSVLEKTDFQLAWYIFSQPPSQKTLILTGPHGTGKSSSIQLHLQPHISASKEPFVLSVSLEPEAPPKGEEEKTRMQGPIEIILNAAENFIEEVQKQMTEELKTEVRAVFASHIKQYALRQEQQKDLPSNPVEANKVREAQEKHREFLLEQINTVLTMNYMQGKVTGISGEDLLDISRNCDPSTAFTVCTLAIMGSKKEVAPGELICPLLTDLLNTFGKAITTRQNPFPGFLFLIESIQNANSSFINSSFFLHFLKSLIKYQQHFNVILEGTTLTYDPFKLAVENPEKFLWLNMLEYSKEEFQIYIKLKNPNLNPAETQLIWDMTHGTQELSEQILELIRRGKTLKVIKQSAITNLVSKIDSCMEDQGWLLPMNTSMIPSLQQMEHKELRSFVYFLSHLVDGTGEEDMTHDEFYNNLVAQKLCIFRLCYYNPEKKQIRLENALLKEALPLTKMWQIVGASTQLSRNRNAYQKFLQTMRTNLSSP